MSCCCAHHTDGTVTTFLCPQHAEDDPCYTKALVSGRRRKGFIVKGRCTHCGWSGSDDCPPQGIERPYGPPTTERVCKGGNQWFRTHDVPVLS